MANKKDRIVCFSTTQEQYEELHQLATTRDSLSSLLREVIREYLDTRTRPPAQPTK